MESFSSRFAPAGYPSHLDLHRPDSGTASNVQAVRRRRHQPRMAAACNLVLPNERAAFGEMLAHELRGRDDHEVRRVVVNTWHAFFKHG